MTRRVVLQVCESLREPSVKQQHPSVLVVKGEMEQSWTRRDVDAVAKSEEESWEGGQVRQAPCRAYSCSSHFVVLETQIQSKQAVVTIEDDEVISSVLFCISLHFIFCLFMHFFREFVFLINLGGVYMKRLKNLNMVGILWGNKMLNIKRIQYFSTWLLGKVFGTAEAWTV